MLTPLTTTLKRFRNVISLEGISKTIQINNIALSLIRFFKKESRLISHNVYYRKLKQNIIEELNNLMRHSIIIKRNSKNFHTKINILLLSYISLMFPIVSCSHQNEDSGKFYVGNYTDEIVFKSNSDTINIVLEQLNLAPNLNDEIPYSIVTSNLTDTTKLKLYVSYGNFNPEKPNVFTQVNQLNDTVYIWYSNREPNPKQLAKLNSINQAEPTPPPAYVRIDSILAYSASKTNIISRVIK